ncbi:hypothetical protein AURDEDRAFT_131643 [Auricularia subglabra TFB-10046 SS5]|uniref:Uncharacterized protein n=1 Tax=Auricularia subglabra (strain TFB-10046 / SS5) TaxID=717982 RepID=J0WME4_AURST|nr:hypothetical protein AURDEDRAFT_131643 [Auricularia subglabra TFB-10046 SS5]
MRQGLGWPPHSRRKHVGLSHLAERPTAWNGSDNVPEDSEPRTETTRTPERPQGVPRNDRLCRLCMDKVEDPLHALFECRASLELVARREKFWSQCDKALRELASQTTGSHSRKNAPPLLPPAESLRAMQTTEVMFALLATDATSLVLAMYTMAVMAIYDASERYASRTDYRTGTKPNMVRTRGALLDGDKRLMGPNWGRHWANPSDTRSHNGPENRLAGKQ